MTDDRSIPDSLKKRLALYEEAGRLRSLGMSHLQIAKQLGVSVDAARALVEREQAEAGPQIRTGPHPEL